MIFLSIFFCCFLFEVGVAGENKLQTIKSSAYGSTRKTFSSFAQFVHKDYLDTVSGLQLKNISDSKFLERAKRIYILYDGYYDEKSIVRNQISLLQGAKKVCFHEKDFSIKLLGDAILLLSACPYKKYIPDHRSEYVSNIVAQLLTSEQESSNILMQAYILLKGLPTKQMIVLLVKSKILLPDELSKQIYSYLNAPIKNIPYPRILFKS